MFTIIKILFYGWPTKDERSAAGEIDQVLFAERNQAYGACELRRNQGWYLLTALSLVIGIGGSLLLAYIWWVPPKKAEAPPKSSIPVCRFFSLPAPPPPSMPPPNAYPHRKGEGTVKMHEFQPPDPSPIAPHYGPGVGFAQGEERDGWLLPDLPGEDEVVPEVVKSIDGFMVPDAIACGFVDESPRPVNLEEMKALIPILRTDYPTRPYLLSCKINKRGEYVEHTWITEAPAYIREQIDPYLVELRFVPKIQDGRPKHADLFVSLEIPDLVSDWVKALP